MVARPGDPHAPDGRPPDEPPTGATRARQVDLFNYRVRIAPWLLDHLGETVAGDAPAHTVVIISDDEVAPLYLPAALGSLHHALPKSRTLFRAIPAGERHKTRETWAALTDWMLGERCGRDTTVVALGGGVVGDVAGFVAATFMRGVPFVQCPTSLLAMVDASVGGKVGVDTLAGKNLVGAFHQPAAVLVDPTVLQTLTSQHRRAGLAEVVKHGIIADAAYLEQAVQLGATIVDGHSMEWHGESLADLITRSIEIKADVVRQDEREGGIRQILNFGHTIGHAIEAESGFSLLHGDAIAIGMALESALAERMGVADTGTGAAVSGALDAIGLPTSRPALMSTDSLLERMRGDKKGRGGQLVMALPRRLGEMATVGGRYGITVDETAVRSVL